MLTKLALIAVMLDYRALLPKEPAAVAGPTVIRHLLQKHQKDVDSCVAMSNVKEKYWHSPGVLTQTGSLKFRIRKAKNENPVLLLESNSCVPTLEGCVTRIFQSAAFKEQWRDETIDGHIIVNTDCQVDIEHNILTRDEIEVRCKADWNYYPLGEAFPESQRKAWKS